MFKSNKNQTRSIAFGVILTITFFFILLLNLDNRDFINGLSCIIIYFNFVFFGKFYWCYCIKNFLDFLFFKKKTTIKKFIFGFFIFFIFINITSYIFSLLITLNFQKIIFLYISQWAGLFGNYLIYNICKYYREEGWLNLIKFIFIILFFFIFIFSLFSNEIIFFLLDILPIPQNYLRSTYIYKFFFSKFFNKQIHPSKLYNF